ncbi:hypothetical protein V5O48_009636 [Marasmius crinis-equi]|uniref:NADH:flavin oxidoreductase/NADH oxidase N-terminal domain-containing protein n=1 Tax=Marasmius crinis-equi TaxID=585013 RepID=A0ABR3FAR8_9AGAR
MVPLFAQTPPKEKLIPMAANVAPLFQPLEVGSLTLKNRVVMSALTRNRAVPNTVPNEVNVEYYRQRARGGAALIVSEGTLITPQGTEWPYVPGISTDEHVQGWKKVTGGVHGEGGLIFCQLWHTGRLSHPDAPEQKKSGPVYGPSAISARGGKFRFLEGTPGYQIPTEIDDPRQLIKLFKHAAENAKAAGFDGVELQGGNGYLIHQFLDSTSNKRTDHWGGSVKNRARFGLETLEVLSEVWGPDRVGVKLAPTGGYNDMGMPLEETLETFRYFISEADKLGIAYFCLVRYQESADPVIDGIKRGTEHDVVGSYRSYIRNARLFANGGILPDEAVKLVSEGNADAIVFGFLHVAHPDLAKRIQFGKPLHPEATMKQYLNGPGGSVEDQVLGYTDYPEEKYD